MDVIALAEAGIDHAVAPLGTAITEAPARGALEARARARRRPRRRRRRPRRRPAADRPRAAAPRRPAARCASRCMPPGQDPDDVVPRGGAAAIAAVLAASRPIVDLLWARETEGPGPRQPRAPRRPRRPPARPPRPHRRPLAARPLGARDPQPAAPRSSRRRRVRRAPPTPGGRAVRPRRRAAAPARSGRRRADRRRAQLAPRRAADATAPRGPHPRERDPRRLPQPSRVALELEERLEAPRLPLPPTSRKFATPSCPRWPNPHMSRTRAIRSAQACTRGSAATRCPSLTPVGQVRANRHLGPGADADSGPPRDRRGADPPRRARPAAPRRSARRSTELAGEPDEALTARLRARRRGRARRQYPPAREDDDSDDEPNTPNSSASSRDVEAQQAARRPRKR